MFWNWFGLVRRQEPRDRLLFPYRDGISKRRADPVYIEKILAEHLGSDWAYFVMGLSVPYPPGLIGDAADQARKQRADDRARARAAICAAFDVVEYKHGREIDPETGKPNAGLGEIELFGLLEGYQRWAAALLELSRPFASAQPRASPTPEPPPAPSGPDSTSAAIPSPAPAPPPSGTS